jgi:hypothetical protein
LFALRQDEQTFARRTEPFLLIFIECRFGSQRRLVRRTEWLTEFPLAGPFPQMSHLAAIAVNGSMGATSRGVRRRAAHAVRRPAKEEAG